MDVQLIGQGREIKAEKIDGEPVMNANLIVMIAVLIIWIGIFGYLFNLDKKVKKLEDKK